VCLHSDRGSCGHKFGYFSDSTFPKEVIWSLPVTVIVEAAIGFGYSTWQCKPIGPIVFTSIFANLITQSMLWIALNIFFQHYRVTLFVAEILIWMTEGVWLNSFRANRLDIRQALALSLLMNLSSFGLGWFLRI